MGRDLVAKKCPDCTSEFLVIRQGKSGHEFLGCQNYPLCRHTEPCPDSIGIHEYKEPSDYCKKCNHTGLLPFIKDGNVIPNAGIHCECNQPDSHMTTFSRRARFNIDSGVDMFDFPCSRDFRRFYETERGMTDPGSTYPEEPQATKEAVIVHRHSNMAPEESKLLQDTARGLQRVGQTLNEHLNWKKTQVAVRPGTGIKID